MPRTYVVFELDEERLDWSRSMITTKAIEERDTKRIERLIQELKGRGYDVLKSLGTISGIPTSLIVIGEGETLALELLKLKEDFFIIEKEQGLEDFFMLGEAYSETGRDIDP